MGQASSSSVDAVSVGSGSASARAAPGSRASRAARRLELAALDQDGAHRSADQATRDDAADRDGDRDRRCADDAGLFEERRECEPGRRPARQRHGSGQHAKQRVKPEAERDQDADDVLKDGKDGREQEEAKHLRPADLEQREARAKADRREEGDHHRALQRRVELDERHSLAARDEDGHGDDQAAEHRRRQVVALEDRHEAPEPVAEEQRDAGECERLDEI